MKRMKMWKSLCVVLTATMVLTVGGCGASTGQATASASVEKSLQDPEDITSAVQENSDTSDVSSKTESEKENAQPSVAGEEETSEAVRLEDEEDTLAFPAGMPSEFMFSSGAGGWSTDLRIQPSGYFVGTYLDSDMGTSDEDYPNGTVYYCYFGGNLEVVQKLDDYSYALKLASLEVEKGKEYIEDGVRYVPSEPYGMEKGKNYILYLPDTPLEELSEEFLMWWPGRYDMQEQEHTTLGYYGLYNQDMEYGFFGEVEQSAAED